MTFPPMPNSFGVTLLMQQKIEALPEITLDKWDSDEGLLLSELVTRRLRASCTDLEPVPSISKQVTAKPMRISSTFDLPFTASPPDLSESNLLINDDESMFQSDNFDLGSVIDNQFDDNLKRKISTSSLISKLPYNFPATTSSENPSTLTLEQCAKLGLDMNECVGQGYDGAANTAGHINGVQTRISSQYPKAIYIDCVNHRLNLALSNAMSLPIIKNCLGRWSVLKQKVTILIFKPLSDTRYESRVNSVRALKYQIGDVYDVLVKISLNFAKDSTTRNEAKSLGNKIKNFKFMVSLILWYVILNRTNSVSKLLQNPNLNVLQGTKSLKGLHTYFLDERNKKQFKKLVVDVGQLTEELEMEATFIEEERVRPRKKPVFLVTKVR
ncbi:hypothetical protein ILUMI_10275 [Ignelater luminosus]|uniref:DUF4371 domain-containing protein n=1 Tax=Ignelater luminosus TaxID=2038154 RepID=A0A8K0GF51_IGNLU|nr:hypothetical protein ILUMI_10275 [Ignelater luminosus]